MRSDIIKEARQWVGTPYHHQAYLKYVGCDCVGLIVGVGIHSGMLQMSQKDIDAYRGYGRTPRPDHMGKHMAKHLARIDDPGIGDIVWLQWRENLPMHVAIISEHNGMRTLIHAYRDAKAVVEQTIGRQYEKYFHSFWRYPGLN